MKMEVFEYLLAIEKYGSLNQAAEHLYVSQPNLTNVIHSLEAELGYPVLSRGHRGVQFTEQGRQVLLCAHAIVREKEKLQEIGQERPVVNLKISIGHFDGIAEELCAEIAKAGAAEELHISISSLPVMQALEAVYRQTLDLAYMIIPTTADRTVKDYADSHDLLIYSFKENMCRITMRKGHPLLQEGFSREQLWNYPFVDYSDQYAEPYGSLQQYINPHKIITADSSAVRRMILLGTDAYAVGMHREGQPDPPGMASIPIPELFMHLAEIRRSTDQNSRFYNTLRRGVERRT